MLCSCVALYLVASLRVVGALVAIAPKHDSVRLEVANIWDGFDLTDEQEREQKHETVDEDWGKDVEDKEAMMRSDHKTVAAATGRHSSTAFMPVNLMKFRHGTDRKKAAAQDGQPQLYVLLGPPDSGTNLLMQLIKHNWRKQFRCTQERSPYAKKHLAAKSIGPLKNKKKNVTDSFGELWKHSNSGAEDIYALLEENMENKWSRQQISDTVAIIMVRSPISQIASWKKAPYELGSCANRHYEAMAKPCHAPLRARKSGQIANLHRADDLLHFKSTMDVYNQYMKQYRTMKENGRFKELLLITYEDLVYSPEEQLKRIAGAFGVEVPEVAVLMETEAKKHGQAVGREAAIEKLKNRAYLDAVEKTDLEAICRGIDTDVLQGYVEGTYLKSEDESLRVDYTYDCRDVMDNGNSADTSTNNDSETDTNSDVETNAEAGADDEGTDAHSQAGADEGETDAHSDVETIVKVDAGADEVSDVEEANEGSDIDKDTDSNTDVEKHGRRLRKASKRTLRRAAKLSSTLTRTDRFIKHQVNQRVSWNTTSNQTGFMNHSENASWSNRTNPNEQLGQVKTNRTNEDVRHNVSSDQQLALAGNGGRYKDHKHRNSNRKAVRATQEEFMKRFRSRKNGADKHPKPMIHPKNSYNDTDLDMQTLTNKKNFAAFMRMMGHIVHW